MEQTHQNKHKAGESYSQVSGLPKTSHWVNIFPPLQKSIANALGSDNLNLKVAKEQRKIVEIERYFWSLLYVFFKNLYSTYQTKMLPILHRQKTPKTIFICTVSSQSNLRALCMYSRRIPHSYKNPIGSTNSKHWGNLKKNKKELRIVHKCNTYNNTYNKTYVMP